MNKSELVSEIAQKTTLTKTQVKQVVEETFSFISSALSKGEKFQLIGFGSFKVEKRASRKGVNPQTGEKISIPARKVPVFSPGKKLMDSVNNNKGK